MMQGGLSPDLDICWFEQVFSGIKARYPIHIHSLSPPEVAHIADAAAASAWSETLRRLRAAGLDSLPGGGAEVLVDRVRRAISPHKIPTDTWLDVMRDRPRPRHEDHGHHDVRLARHARPSASSTCAASVSCRTRPAASRPSSRGPSRPATRSCRPATSPPRASTTCACSRSAACTSTTCPTCRPRGSRRACAWARWRWRSAPTTWAPP